MISRAVVALSVLAGIPAVALSAQQPSPGDVCLEASCLEATVYLSRPTVVLVVPPPDAPLPDSALLRRWEQRVGDLYQVAQRPADAAGFQLEVRAPAFRGFQPALPQVFGQPLFPQPQVLGQRYFLGIVIVAPGQRAVAFEGYPDEETLGHLLAKYGSPVRPLEGRQSS
jgi:hypothetical protein